MEGTKNNDYVIVFLDDDENRAALLYNRMNHDDQQRTFWSKTVEEALEILTNYRERLKYLSLEHDLDSIEYMHSGSERSGMEVVRWLEKKDSKDYKHAVFIVHTHNTSAGIKMTMRLRNKGYKVLYVPFGYSHETL